MNFPSVLYCILILLFFAHSVVARTNCGEGKVEPYLGSLDHVLSDIHIYTQQKRNSINNIKQVLSNTPLTDESMYFYEAQLFMEYSTVSSQKMYKVTKDMISLANKMNDRKKIFDAQMNLAKTYFQCGAFKETEQYISSLSLEGLTKEELVRYYMFKLELEYEGYLLVKPTEMFKNHYVRVLRDIHNRIETLEPINSDNVLRCKQRLASVEENYHLAFNIAYKRLEINKKSKNMEQIPIITGDLGFYNLEMGDTLKAMDYMVRSAIMNIKQGSKLNPAIRKIAEVLYELQDENRAQRYIQLSMDNAVDFNSNYRIYESSISLPKIYNRIDEIKSEQQRIRSVLLVISFALFLTTLVTLFILRKNVLKLRASKEIVDQKNKEQENINSQLSVLNSILKEASSIKTTYLTRILVENSSIISEIEDIIRFVKIKIKAKQYNDIIDHIYQHNYIQKRISMLKNFDKMFLNVFPNFVEDFNKLLKPEYRIILENESTLTPVIRIFALERLGISNSETIGKILNLSSSTIRNYKTKTRKEALYPSEQFDEYVLRIPLREESDEAITISAKKSGDSQN